MQIFAMLRGNYARATRDGEDNVQINLRAGVGHFSEFHMALLAELIIEAFFGRYKHVAPMALTDRVASTPDRHPSAEVKLL